MTLATDLIVLLALLQCAAKLSLLPHRLAPWVFAAVVGVALCMVAEPAATLSKPQVEGWLHSVPLLQSVAIAVMGDALLTILLPAYPGLLVVAGAAFVMVRLLFVLVGLPFLATGVLVGVTVAAVLPLAAIGMRRLLPMATDRRTLHLLLTIAATLTTLLLPIVANPLPSLNTQNIAMQYISQTLFGIANMLLIPDIILLIFFFVRSLLLLAGTYRQWMGRRGNGRGTLYAKYETMLLSQPPSEAWGEYVVTQFEAEAAKDVNLSRLLTKLGPVLGLIGTLISMSPALVGLSTGDIAGMAYNMQVVFSATVVGLFISAVGLFTQQLKARWHVMDASRLDFEWQKRIEGHEKEA